jgi:hypothetical protein
MPTKRTRRARHRIEGLSAAERQWLTGEDQSSAPDWDEWDEFFLWCLDRGERSCHEGRWMTPRQLLETFGHRVPPQRRRLLDARLRSREEANHAD